MTHKQIYIYTYKYTKPSNTLTLSRPKYLHKPTSHKQPDDYTNKRKSQAIYIGQNAQAA